MLSRFLLTQWVLNERSHSGCWYDCRFCWCCENIGVYIKWKDLEIILLNKMILILTINVRLKKQPFFQYYDFASLRSLLNQNLNSVIYQIKLDLTKKKPYN